jgi:uncharacterized protein YfiM (DUF2279 family)
MGDSLKTMGLSCNGYSKEELDVAELAAARWLAAKAGAELENEKGINSRQQQARAVAFSDKIAAEKLAAIAKSKASDAMFFAWLMTAVAAAMLVWSFFHIGGLAR